MMFPCNIYNDNAFNRYTNLDNVEWNIIMHLVESQTKFANNIWKILKYNTEDCLLLDNVDKKDRLSLIYTNNGDASVKRVFMTPFIDDSWEMQSSHLHVYVDTLMPQNHLNSVVNIRFETIVHNKISNIIGDGADGENFGEGEFPCNKDCTNPSEFREIPNPNYDNTQPPGPNNSVYLYEPWVMYKNRATVFLKSVLAELNGTFVNGVGKLQFNAELSPYCQSRNYVWNGRKFYGHSTVLATMMSGVSSNSGIGY